MYKVNINTDETRIQWKGDDVYMKSFNVGDRVWFIKSFEEIYWRSGMFRPTPTRHPFEKKITQVVHTKDGILYQVKGGHFHESWIGTIVFDSKEEAENYISEIYGRNRG